MRQPAFALLVLLVATAEGFWPSVVKGPASSDGGRCSRAPHLCSMSAKQGSKVAVVTGASRGIGKGIALTLGQQGYTVYVTGRSAGGTCTKKVSGIICRARHS